MRTRPTSAKPGSSSSTDESVFRLVEQHVGHSDTDPSLNTVRRIISASETISEKIQEQIQKKRDRETEHTNIEV